MKFEADGGSATVSEIYNLTLGNKPLHARNRDWIGLRPPLRNNLASQHILGIKSDLSKIFS